MPRGQYPLPRTFREFRRLTRDGRHPICALSWRSSSAVEQGNHNPLVGGSNPSSATMHSDGVPSAPSLLGRTDHAFGLVGSGLPGTPGSNLRNAVRLSAVAKCRQVGRIGGCRTTSAARPPSGCPHRPRYGIASWSLRIVVEAVMISNPGRMGPAAVGMTLFDHMPTGFPAPLSVHHPASGHGRARRKRIGPRRQAQPGP